MVLSVSRHECLVPKSQTEEIDSKRDGVLREQYDARRVLAYTRVCALHKPNNVVKSLCRRDA